ncbi:MAG TPA: hypothetical protein VG538_05190 [Vicinamibacterales bacterium]|nr:hypothetical protein [Vicinamibacterales bacterium]
MARGRRAGRGGGRVRDCGAPARAADGRHPARARHQSVARGWTAGAIHFLHVDGVVDSRLGDVDHLVFICTFIVFDRSVGLGRNDDGQHERGAGDLG